MWNTAGNWGETIKQPVVAFLFYNIFLCSRLSISYFFFVLNQTKTTCFIILREEQCFEGPSLWLFQFLMQNQNHWSLWSVSSVIGFALVWSASFIWEFVKLTGESLGLVIFQNWTLHVESFGESKPSCNVCYIALSTVVAWSHVVLLNIILVCMSLFLLGLGLKSPHQLYMAWVAWKG